MITVQACLNGPRASGVPVTPEQLAADAAACVAEGAGSLHLHVRDDTGAESLEPLDVAATWSPPGRPRPRTPRRSGSTRARGHDVRIGLEDTLVLPDGAPASGNAELVRYCLNGS